MSRRRTRADTSGKPGYITPEGYRRFEEEADRLWNVERPKMAKALQVAAAEGDRSENAEYQYSKQRLAAIDRRLRFLGQRLEALTIVDESPPDDGRVYFGSWVTLEDEDGRRKTHRVVGPDEIDAKKGWISMDSPVGRALLSREEGDELTIRRPRGEVTYQIIEVRNTRPVEPGETMVPSIVDSDD
jgi:transcription elongation factor GreB